MIGDKIIKVCGMREADNIRALEQSGVDVIGFIFYPKSPRYVAEKPAYLPFSAKRVGVFVNETLDTITAVANLYELDFIQLHGNESPEECRNLRKTGKKIIKAFSIAAKEDLYATKNYESVCDYFLFDTKCPDYGGSGKQFDWSVLENYTGNTPFLLSGGIDIDSIDSLKTFQHPQLVGYDLNSKFEISPALKDINLIERFLSVLEP